LFEIGTSTVAAVKMPAMDKKETSYPSAMAAFLATDDVTLATVREGQSSAGLS